MKTKISKIVAVAFAMALAGAAFAADNQVRDLARETGLSERQVQMLIGCRSCYSEYKTSYVRADAQFKRTLGRERYQQLMQRLPIALEHQRDKRVIATNNP